MLEPTTLIIMVVGLIAVGGWYYIGKRGRKGRQLTVWMFRKTGVLERVSADDRFGVAHLPDGGYLVRPGSLLHERSGRPWSKPSNAAHAAVLRKRVTLLLLRESDPAPLDLARADYAGEVVELDAVRAIGRQSERLAATEASQEGDPADKLGSRLGLAVVIAVCVAGAAWIGVFGINLYKGLPLL